MKLGSIGSFAVPNCARCVLSSAVLTNRDRLRVNLLAKLYVLDVDLDHLIAYNEDLAHRIVDTPAEVLPLVCALRNGD